jgi:hypothetical protein
MYYYIVRNNLKHTVLVLLISGYALFALAGYLEILRNVLNTDSHVHHVTSAKESHPFDSRPYLAQGKYLPVSTKIEVPPETILSTIQYPTNQLFTFSSMSPDVVISVISVYNPSRPRDPPIA